MEQKRRVNEIFVALSRLKGTPERVCLIGTPYIAADKRSAIAVLFEIPSRKSRNWFPNNLRQFRSNERRIMETNREVVIFGEFFRDNSGRGKHP